MLDKKEVDLDNTVRKWNRDLNSHMTQEEFYEEFTIYPKATISSKLRSFQFRFVHRIVNTNIFANKIGAADSPLCTFCKKQFETVMHLFWECTHIQLFWKDVFNYINNTFNLNVCITNKEALLSSDIDLINICCIIAKQYIYFCKTIKKTA